MKTIATFSNTEAAELLRTRLEAVGIEAFVQDDNVMRLEPFFSNTSASVHVQVADEAAADALEFLATDEPPPLEDEGEVKCPSCGSNDTVLDISWRPGTVLLGMLTKMPTPISRRRWVCRACGNEFQLEGEHPTDSPPSE